MISRDFLGNTWEYDCMGCAIARQEIVVPGGFIRRSRHFCVHQDPLLPLPGFLVIASRRHIRSLDEMSAAEYAEFSGLLGRAQAAIKKITRVEHLTIVQEEHSGHFHLWFFPWLPEVIRKFGEPSLAKIRFIMAEISREPLRPDEWVELEKIIRSISTEMKNS
jgi:diadenosine tetraphosphate (Ap4A) HIT family hydrolase